MPQSVLIFDFGANEDAAQQARHRLDGWRQAYRLGDRVKFKFERKSGDQASEAEQGAEEASDRLRMVVRLEFSDHEKLSYQRWLDRIPAEEPFKSVEKQVLRRNENGFDDAVELFDSLK